MDSKVRWFYTDILLLTFFAFLVYHYNQNFHQIRLQMRRSLNHSQKEVEFQPHPLSPSRYEYFHCQLHPQPKVEEEECPWVNWCNQECMKLAAAWRTQDFNVAKQLPVDAEEREPTVPLRLSLFLRPPPTLISCGLFKQIPKEVISYVMEKGGCVIKDDKL